MYVLSELFVRTGVTLDEYYAKPPNIRAFMFASIVAKIEREAKEKKGGCIFWQRQ